MDLAARIKEARESAGLSKAELAREIGITKSAITRWESGEAKQITYGSLAALSKATGRPVQYFFGGVADPITEKLQQLTPQQRQAVVAMIDAILAP